jgi:hypothetical protein
MKDVTVGLIIILAVALVGGVIFAISLIGSAALTVLATLLIGGLVLAGLIAVSALPIRAWRKNDAKPIERQVIREVHILDNRPAPLPQLPASQQPSFGVFPELLRASYQAGQLAAPHGETVDAQVTHLSGDDWTGDITA